MWTKQDIHTLLAQHRIFERADFDVKRNKIAIFCEFVEFIFTMISDRNDELFFSSVSERTDKADYIFFLVITFKHMLDTFFGLTFDRRLDRTFFRFHWSEYVLNCFFLSFKRIFSQIVVCLIFNRFVCSMEENLFKISFSFRWKGMHLKFYSSFLFP